jgi:hypothetical protein
MRVQPATIGRKDLSLNVISCLSSTYCEVGGQLTPPNSDSFGLFFGTWNGKSIAEQKAALPKGGKEAVVGSLSCAGTNLCAATGISQITATAVNSYAETWNGRAWTATPVAKQQGAPFSFLSGVACPAVRLCVAVGSATANLADGGTPQALAYNGKSWSRQAVPAAEGAEDEFESVSCPSAKLCVALGTSGGSGPTALSPLAGFWNGQAWRLAAA